MSLCCQLVNEGAGLSTARDDESRYRIAIIDEDPLRARREARELLSEITETDPDAELRVPRQQAADATEKGGVSADLVGLLISGGSLVAACLQIWLARVPQRTIIATRPDGATLRISGREARADDERIARFLRVDGPEDGGDSEDGGDRA